MPTEGGARITYRRRLTWAETDATGHQHFSAVVRWLEEAEHELWRQLGLVDLVPCVPRVHLELDYSARLWFDDAFDVIVLVAEVGRSSCRFALDVCDSSGSAAIAGTFTVVHAPDPTRGAQPWPDRVREALTDGSREFVYPAGTG